MRTTLLITLCIALGLYAMLPALAAPTGLAWTPTAEILAPREVSTSVSLTTVPDDDDEFALNAQVGIFPWLELGYDYAWPANEGIGNFKVGSPLGQGAVAAGLQTIFGDEEEWYLVYSLEHPSVAPISVNFGALDSSVTAVAPFVSLQRPTGSASVMLEAVGGDEPFVALGGTFPVVPGVEGMLSGAFGLPGGMQVYAELGTSFTLK